MMVGCENLFCFLHSLKCLPMSWVLSAFNMLGGTFIYFINPSCFNALKRLFGKCFLEKDSSTRRKCGSLQNVHHGSWWYLGEAPGSWNWNRSAPIVIHSLTSYFQTIKDNNSRFKLWWLQLLSNRFTKLKLFQLWNSKNFWNLEDKWHIPLPNFMISFALIAGEQRGKIHYRQSWQAVKKWRDLTFSKLLEKKHFYFEIKRFQETIFRAWCSRAEH